jgi:hypothetical protein
MGPCEDGNEPSGSIKCGVCLDQLLASQERPCSVELVIWLGGTEFAEHTTYRNENYFYDFDIQPIYKRFSHRACHGRRLHYIGLYSFPCSPLLLF